MSTGIVNINIFRSFQIEKVKMYHDIPYLLPKSYSKLSNERPATLDDFNVVDCQVSKTSLFSPSSTNVHHFLLVLKDTFIFPT